MLVRHVFLPFPPLGPRGCGGAMGQLRPLSLKRSSREACAGSEGPGGRSSPSMSHPFLVGFWF